MVKNKNKVGFAHADTHEEGEKEIVEHELEEFDIAKDDADSITTLIFVALRSHNETNRQIMGCEKGAQKPIGRSEWPRITPDDDRADPI